MTRTAILALLAALLSTATSTNGFAAEPDVIAHLRTLEEGRRGAEVRVRLELSWAGRPEQHIAVTPRIEVPPGAALRAGRAERAQVAGVGSLHTSSTCMR